MKRTLVVIHFLTLTLSASMVESNEGMSGAGLLHQLKFGVLAHDVGDLWSGFNREEGIDLNIEVVFSPSLTILGGALRPALGGSINTAGDTSKGYLDLLWQYNFATGIFFVSGVGAAIHDGKLNASTAGRKALGSRVLFHIPVELGYFISPQTTVSIYFDHISNAYTANENEGMDTLGVRFGYVF
ncbi:acyloxyacyl hydrolase [Nitrosomonas sp.]|uniref:acyloxyacyl hydrolase n=1 Tax=Nitrosomonas sp. TaxID=42353 RepID=UPI002088A261|nr:acyloxyacyl hydrolase [Nitrosomonas sp.]GJL75393.1 MAG: hypothetical protein NMNS02_14990 [Nitrosomonas sp.]